MEEAHSTATRLLRRLEGGDEEAGEELFSVLYGQLRDVADRLMRHEQTGHTLQPTALVHEAWLKLMGRKTQSEWKDSTHFMRLAARAMRNVLVDHARAKQAAKRGKRARLDEGILDQFVGVFEAQSLDLLALNEALDKLAEVDEPMARVVELRFFAGLTVPETARALDVSITTVERLWRLARAWLRTEVPPPEGSAA